MSNIDCSQFSLYLEIKEEFVENFNILYDQKYDATRGLSLKKFIQEKIDIHGIQISRIDLNYDRTPMVNLLETRGSQLKIMNFSSIGTIEKTINELKLKQYHEQIIGAFIIYESIADLKHATVLLNKDRDIKKKLEQNNFKIVQPPRP